ncbi:uncharacterized protein LOC120932066 [Rana temporaria]|uniref:uncharacterized protein LOC120932066 n=1 Tax=Rana temporaria TaxID=8407 RepID=UPI001AAC964A|nr:uncharacterized protein LOC120932066 [Rana temporaria]
MVSGAGLWVVVSLCLQVIPRYCSFNSGIISQPMGCDGSFWEQERLYKDWLGWESPSFPLAAAAEELGLPGLAAPLSKGMESLFKKLLEKAGSEGGEEWLKRCLTMGDIVPEEQTAGVETGAGFMLPTEQQGESASASEEPPVRARRSQPPERTRESLPTEEEERRRGMGEEEDGGGVPASVRRSGRQKRNLSQSPARGKARGGRAAQPSASVGRGRPLPPRPPIQQQVPLRGQEQQVLPVRLEPAASMQRGEPGPAVNAQPQAVGQPRTIWILGHSYIHWAHKRAALRRYSTNLSLCPESFQVFWKGVRGLQWHQLYFHLSGLSQRWPKPDVLLVHAGGNDLGKVRTLDLLFLIQRDLQRFSLASPGTILIFSEIIPRFSWLSSPQRRAMEKMRKRINRAMYKFMPQIGGLSYRHVDLEGGFTGLYRQDGVHLSDVGIDIFNLGLQYGIEQAAEVGWGRA